MTHDHAISRLLGCLSLLAVGCTPPTGTTIDPGEGLARHYQLDNGLEVVLIPDDRLPLVAVDLSYHVGWMHDGARSGVAHLAEHLMFRGTTRMPDGEFHAHLERAGAIWINASTGPSNTSFHMLVPPEQLPIVLWLESDRMVGMANAIDEVAFVEERKTTLDEWARRAESTQLGPLVLAALDAVFPEGHPHHRARPASIERLSADDVREFASRHYGPANATLVLAGDLPDDVHRQIQRYFGHREGGERPSRPEFETPETPASDCDIRNPMAGTASFVMMAWPTPGVFEPGDAEASILADILTMERGRRVVDALFPDSAVSISATQCGMFGQSVFFLSAEFHGLAAPDVRAALDQAMRDLRRNPPKAAEIDRARRRIRTKGFMRAATLEGRASLAQFYRAHDKPPEWLDEDLARYDDVDASSLAFFQARSLHDRARASCTFEAGK